MKKTIFTVVLLSAALTLVFASGASEGDSKEHVDRLINKVGEGDYYLQQFYRYRESQIDLSGADIYIDKDRDRTYQTSTIRNEAPSEQHIDRAIAAYQEALRLQPSGTWKPYSMYAGDLPPQGGIQARVAKAQKIKQEWLTEHKPKIEPVLAAARQAQQAEQAKQQQQQVEQVRQQLQAEQERTLVEAQNAAPNTTPNSPDDFDIIQNEHGGISITRYRGTRLHVVIPETISGVRVTEIRGFRTLAEGREDNSLLSVVIPNTVTAIGSSAFENNTKLSSVVLPNALKIIYAYAFRNCSLTSITLPNRLEEIWGGAFSGNKITSIQLPASLKIIGNGAFYNNNITNLVIPGNVVSLGEGSFSKNPFVSVVIPASLAKYERVVTGKYLEIFESWYYLGFKNAFPTLTSITLPANVNEENLKGNFDDSFVNFWISQNKRAGTYFLDGRIWKVR